jgi:hypothetical protein
VYGRRLVLLHALQGITRYERSPCTLVQVTLSTCNATLYTGCRCKKVTLYAHEVKPLSLCPKGHAVREDGRALCQVDVLILRNLLSSDHQRDLNL